VCFQFAGAVATGLPFWDTQCGFKAFRLEACRPILEAARIEGFAFDVELLYLAHRAGLRIREVPVRWNHAEGSKVSFFRDSLRMLREVITLRAVRAFADAKRSGLRVAAASAETAQMPQLFFLLTRI
jgi:hypothetical protein